MGEHPRRGNKFENRIEKDKARTKPYCNHSKREGHWTNKCRKNPANKCYNCGKFGHKATECWGKKKDISNGNSRGRKNSGGEQSNVMKQSDINEEKVTFIVEKPMKEMDMCMCNENTSGITEMNGDHLVCYDWLADTATSSHITCQRHAFVSYTPLGDTSVTGVGGKQATVAGRGTVDLISDFDGQTIILSLTVGEPNKIVGIEITREENTVTISQKKYIASLLEREGLAEGNPVGTPMDPNMKIGPNKDEREPNHSNSYTRLIGELQYIANGTRPDISYAVNKLAAYTGNPDLRHYSAAKRIRRYLAGTKGYRITYKKPSETTENDNIFLGYADAAFANADDSKSTTGVLALSSTEAEYIAISEASRKASWLRNLYSELGFTQTSPTIIKGDNEGSIILTKNSQFHQRTKHIELRYHYMRNLAEGGVIDVESCRNPEQTTDVLTKAISKPKHERHRSEMGLRIAN